MPVLQSKMRALKSVDETSVKPAIREALRIIKSERNDEYTLGRYGMKWDEFLAAGKLRFPEDQFRTDLFAISEIRLGIELVVAGFLDDGFRCYFISMARAG